MNFIRPSALAIAEKCLLSPALAARFPTTNKNIQRGQEVDSQVSTELKGGAPATDPDAVACVQWIRAHMTVTHVQEEVTLTDDAGTFLTKGTPDVIGRDTWDDSLIVCDLKKIHQYRNAYVAEPNENLQLHSYALAHRAGFTKYRTALLLFGDGPLEAVWSKEFTQVEWTPILDRIARIQESAHSETGGDGSGDATLPIGMSGEHCVRCFSRPNCKFWLLPVPVQEDALMEPFSRPGGLNAETVGPAYLATKALKELAERAEGLIKAYRQANGEGSVKVGDRSWEPVQVKGRQSVDLQKVKELGLNELIKEGQPYEQWRMVRLR